ncbi:MAG TPA: carboxypeptidase regulatory-like domain-containing protein [Clostridia bacterium]|nr:carboxypeptidase regulatory-like domain-containing protein [Clostridia bacterium]
MRTNTMMKVCCAVLLLTAMAAAQNVTGTVRNGTTGKPAAGVEVVLLDLSQGMNEAAKTKTDAEGRFSMPMEGGQVPHLVRVSYQNASYFKMVPPGTSTAEIQIYEAAKKIDALAGNVNVIRVQADGNTMQVIELYAVRNDSRPPRTVVGDSTFEVVLPEGAQIDTADAQGPNGQPVSNVPTPLKEKNHYGFSFPLRPGETRFQLAYHLHYSGNAVITPRLAHAFDHFVVVLPATMGFEAKNAAQFRPMPDQQGTNVQVVTNARPGQDLSFRVSGQGAIPEDQTEAAQSQSGGATGGTQNDSRPGGGLGPPIDAPDPLAKYKWWVLGGLGIALTGGAYMLTRRPAALATTGASQTSAAAPAASASAPVAISSGNALLEAMKEELFQLEIERQQGAITQEEYEKHKAALDQTLQRALSRATRV